MLTLIHHGARLVEKIDNLLSILISQCSRLIAVQSVVCVGLTRFSQDLPLEERVSLYSQEPFYLLLL